MDGEFCRINCEEKRKERRINLLAYAAVNVFETLLRVVPFPCKTGVIKIGAPDKSSPVFLTGNYHLTVVRVSRALRDIDCYLLVANSRGYNVWCGAAGGHFTDHDVISVLKTSGVESLVTHRDVVLPQLAATGVEAGVIRKKAGWRVIWGPVYARDIPVFITSGFEKTAATRQVDFALGQRVEMACMWAFPFSVIAALATALFWLRIVLPLTVLIWALSSLVFLSFPLYSSWLRPGKGGTAFSKYTVVFDFSRVLIILWSVFILGLIIFYLFADGLGRWSIFRWGLVSFIIVLLLSIDLKGSTPVYKSGLHADIFLTVFLDKERCRGAGFCEQVCPRNCYRVARAKHTATLVGSRRCVQCGACIVQCPFDALYFTGPRGEILSPATIRKFKLNLLGERVAGVGRNSRRRRR